MPAKISRFGEQGKTGPDVSPTRIAITSRTLGKFADMSYLKEQCLMCKEKSVCTLYLVVYVCNILFRMLPH